MELILVDEKNIDIGEFTGDVDFETGDDSTLNDFEIISSKIKEGYSIYSHGSEFGGIIEYFKSTSEAEEQTWKGHTWRGLLMQDIIEPPAGSDYKIVSGEANKVIRELLSNVLGGFFIVPDVNSGLIIQKHQFQLYCKVGTGIMDMLQQYGYRLWIHAEKEVGEQFKVYAEAVKCTRVEGEYNSDSSVKMRFINDKMGINHLVCMGKGELQNRQRVDLYVQADGSIGKTKYFNGFYERKAYYDYGSAESLDDLEKNGIKRLKELKKGMSLEMDIPDQDYEIGDLILGRDRRHGLFIEKAIIGKILRRTGGVETIEYKVKGD